MKFSFRNSRGFPRFRNNRRQVIQLFLSLWLRCAPFRSEKTSEKPSTHRKACKALLHPCFYHCHDEVVKHLEFPHQCIEIHIQYPCSHVRTPPDMRGVCWPMDPWMTTNDGVYCHHFLEATGTQPRLSTCLSNLFSPQKKQLPKSMGPSMKPSPVLAEQRSCTFSWVETHKVAKQQPQLNQLSITWLKHDPNFTRMWGHVG